MMMSKKQEREALEKIKEILDSLDANGYVRTAFEGCVEDAEENIECDFALSYKDRYLSECRRHAEGYESLQKTIKEMSEANMRHQEQIAKLDKDRADLEAQLELTTRSLKQANDVNTEISRENSDLVMKVKDLNDQIIRLKAKIYDLTLA